jgi:hypothetical protein
MADPAVYSALAADTDLLQYAWPDDHTGQPMLKRLLVRLKLPVLFAMPSRDLVCHAHALLYSGINSGTIAMCAVQALHIMQQVQPPEPGLGPYCISLKKAGAVLKDVATNQQPPPGVDRLPRVSNTREFLEADLLFKLLPSPKNPKEYLVRGNPLGPCTGSFLLQSRDV